MQPVSALDLLQRERAALHISTGSRNLDSLLGNGLPSRCVTELTGPPGIGKTQICMQLAVNVNLPEKFGGLDGQAIVVDTEGSMIVDRLAEIASRRVEEIRLTDQIEADWESLLSGIHIFRLFDHVQILAFVNLLHEYLSQNPQIRLVVIDSLAFHFRHAISDLGARHRLLHHIAQTLSRCAAEYDVSIVVSNQLTMKIMKTGIIERMKLLPALGDSWGHACTHRIMLFWENSARMANVMKSSSSPSVTVAFAVTGKGITDISVT
ncbi:Rad51C protein [Cladochytrium replicatum]|nr:Rad51C protein [Cladochytrium replicatum]